MISTLAMPPQGIFVPPRAITYLIATSDAPAHVKAQADYVCDGVADNVEIQAAFDAGNTSAVPFSVSFVGKTFHIAAQINGRNNCHLIFNDNLFEGDFAGIIFNWAGTIAGNISSEGRVTFDGNDTATRAVHIDVWETVLTKNIRWMAETTIYGFTTSGITVTGIGSRYGRIISLNQRTALQFLYWSDIVIDEFKVVFSTGPTDNSSIDYNTASPASHYQPKNLTFKKVDIDLGHVQGHGFTMSYANRWAENVVFEDFSIKNSPETDTSSVILNWINGLTILHFFGDGANLNITSRNIHIGDITVQNAHNGGLTIEQMGNATNPEGNINVVINNATLKNNGHYGGWTVAGLLLVGGTYGVHDVLVHNLRAFDDQNEWIGTLSADAASGQAIIYLVGDMYGKATPWYVGQRLTLSDDTPQSESVIIASIDYDLSKITLTANLANSYTTAATAIITGVQCQDYGVYFSGVVDGVRVTNSDVRGNLTAPVFYDTGTYSEIKFEDVAGYIALGEVRNYSGSLTKTDYTFTTVTGTFTETGTQLKPGANTLHCTADGTAKIDIPTGSVAIAASVGGGATVADSPKTLVTDTAFAVTAGGTNEFTITITHIAFAWHNPEAQDVFAYDLISDITTAGGTATAVLQVGVADDAIGTNLGSEFFATIDLNTAQVNHVLVDITVQDSASATDGWIVGKIITEKADALVGKYYIKAMGK